MLLHVKNQRTMGYFDLIFIPLWSQSLTFTQSNVYTVGKRIKVCSHFTFKNPLLLENLIQGETNFHFQYMFKMQVYVQNICSFYPLNIVQLSVLSPD